MSTLLTSVHALTRNTCYPTLWFLPQINAKHEKEVISMHLMFYLFKMKHTSMDKTIAIKTNMNVASRAGFNYICIYKVAL